MNRASSELVLPEWLRTLTGIPGAASQLPAPDANGNLSWAASGFVTAEVVGGSFNSELLVGRPVVEIHTWAVKPGSARPLWNRATNLMMAVIHGCYDEPNIRRLLTLTSGGADYGTARLLEIYPLQDPMKITDDPGGYAHVVCQFHVHWVAIS